MKKQTIIFLFLIFGKASYSQTFGGTDQTIAPVYYNLSTIENNKKYTTSYFKDVEGSPYIFKDFVDGEITGVPSKFKLRYNAYDDVIEVEKKPGEVYTVSKEPKYNTFLLFMNKYKIRLINHENDNKESNLNYFFEVNKTAKITLLRKDKINFIEGRLPRNSFDLGSKPKFSPVISTYYLEQNDSKLVELPTSKSKLLALYPANQDEIKKFIKKTSIDFNNEKDLIALTQFLTSL